MSRLAGRILERSDWKLRILESDSVDAWFRQTDLEIWLRALGRGSSRRSIVEFALLKFERKLCCKLFAAVISRFLAREIGVNPDQYRRIYLGNSSFASHGEDLSSNCGGMAGAFRGGIPRGISTAPRRFFRMVRRNSGQKKTVQVAHGPVLRDVFVCMRSTRFSC
jgi:hypothetical protein